MAVLGSEDVQAVTALTMSAAQVTRRDALMRLVGIAAFGTSPDTSARQVAAL
jgi:hypothetical protein